MGTKIAENDEKFSTRRRQDADWPSHESVCDDEYCSYVEL
jgi:hypothetical protein